jgi:hypothetical protein
VSTTTRHRARGAKKTESLCHNLLTASPQRSSVAATTEFLARVLALSARASDRGRKASTVALPFSFFGPSCWARAKWYAVRRVPRFRRHRPRLANEGFILCQFGQSPELALESDQASTKSGWTNPAKRPTGNARYSKSR